VDRARLADSTISQGTYICRGRAAISCARQNLLDTAEALRDRGLALRSLTEHIDAGNAAGKDALRRVRRGRAIAALRQSLPDFLLNSAEEASIAKFMLERQDHDTMEMFSVAS